MQGKKNLAVGFLFLAGFMVWFGISAGLDGGGSRLKIEGAKR